MAFTITNAIDEVRGNINRDVSAFSDAKILQALNWSQTEAESFINFDEMHKSRADQTTKDRETLTVLAAVKNIVSILIDDNGSSLKLSFIPLREFDDRFPTSSTDPTRRTGRPVFYTLRDRSMLFSPVPDSAYVLTLHQFEFSPDLTTSSQVGSNFMLDNKYSQLLTSGATAFAFRNLREIEDAHYWDKRVFRQHLQTAAARQLGSKDWQKFADGFHTPRHTVGGALYSPRNPFSGIGF